MTLENFIHLPFRLKYEAFLRFWLNSPALKQEAIYRHMWEIEQLAFEHMRPGTVTGELFDMAEQAVEEAGLVYLWTGLGHSVGLRVHEGFEIAHGSDQVLQSGMVICIEPTCIEQDAK